MPVYLKHHWFFNVYFPDIRQPPTPKLPMTYSNLVKYILVSKSKTFIFFSLCYPFRIWTLLVSILIFMAI